MAEAKTPTQIAQETGQDLPQYGASGNYLGSNIITTDTLTPAQKIVLGNFPQPDVTGLLGTTQGAVDYTKSISDRANLAEAEGESSKKDITRLMESLVGKTADIQAANEASGLNATTKQLNELNAQAQSLFREAQAIPLQIQEQFKNTGATERGVAPHETSALRQNAIKALSIAQQTDIATANYVAAKDKAQQIIDLKYKPIEDLLAIKKQQYEFNKDTLERIDKKRTEALNIALKKEERDLEIKKMMEKTNNDTKLSYIKYAMDGGQSELASQMQLLDTTSPTFSQDISKLQSQITNPLAKLDIAIKQQQLTKLQKETSLLGEPTTKDKQEESKKLRTQQGIVDTMKEKIDLIDAIKDNRGMDARVGTSPLTRKGIGWENINPFTYLKGLGDVYSDLSGKGQQFAGGVHQLASQEFVDALIESKKQGATFGALTDREGDALRAAATKINDWEIKDKNGKGVGIWNIDQKSFNAELDRIKRLAQKAISGSSGSLLDSEEESILDEVFNSSQGVSDFYNK